MRDGVTMILSCEALLMLLLMLWLRLRLRLSLVWVHISLHEVAVIVLSFKIPRNGATVVRCSSWSQCCTTALSSSGVQSMERREVLGFKVRLCFIRNRRCSTGIGMFIDIGSAVP